MKKKEKRKHPRRTFLLILLLACLCIGGVELVACRYFAPELYHRITDPVVQAVVSTAQACSSSVHNAVEDAKHFYRGNASGAGPALGGIRGCQGGGTVGQ